jgi:hypothetical protein
LAKAPFICYIYNCIELICNYSEKREVIIISCCVVSFGIGAIGAAGVGVLEKGSQIVSGDPKNIHLPTISKGYSQLTSLVVAALLIALSLHKHRRLPYSSGYDSFFFR